jgi:hypothetical protein
MKAFRFFSISLVVLASMAPVSRAQVDTGSILGTVRDSSGGVLPGATVTLTQKETNVATRATTNSRGGYEAVGLSIGTYTVTVSLPGFKAASRENVGLRIQDRLRIDFILEVGSATETVVVSTEAPLLQTQEGSLGQVIESKQIEALPVNGRSFLPLAALTPGVWLIGGSTNGNAGEEDTVITNGMRASSTNFMLDGVDNNNNDSPGHPIVEPNVDAISEFKVQTSNYSAEFGRNGGAVINMTIKSGGNDTTGTVFLFGRNQGLEARDFFADPNEPKAPFDFYQFGGTLGAPIVRDKTFFFADFQGTKSKRSDTLTLSVPTASMRAGDFSEAGNPTIFDPQTGQPFDGNVIPANRISPLAQAFINLYPNPNREGLRNNYVVAPTVTQDVYQGDLRLDQNFSTSDFVFLRGSYVNSKRFTPAPLPGIAGGGDYGAGDTDREIWGAALGYSKTLTDHSANEFRAGFNRLSTSVGVPAGGTFVPPANLLVPGVTLDPRVNGLTNFAPDSYSFIGDPEFNPTYTLSQEIQISDTLTFLLGQHTLRAGVVVRQSRFNLFQIPQPRGKFTFSGEFTMDPETQEEGDPMADALLGLASQTDIQNITDVKNRTMYYAGFIQDDFRVTNDLTVNIGLRYEYTSPTIEINDQQSNLDFATGDLRVAGQNGNSRGLIDVDKNNISPRLGFAWRPGGSENWVVRGGYGRFYNNQEPRTAFQLGFNPPFFFSVTRFSDFGVTPAGIVDQGFPPVSPEDAEFPILVTVDERFRSPYYDQWNVAIQRSLPWQSAIEIGYVGTRGHRLQVLRDENQPTPAEGDVQQRRPFPQYGNFASIRNDGKSAYDGFQVKLSKRLTQGFWFLASYTYGKAKSDQGEIGLASPWPQNSLDVASDYGRSDGDQVHKVTASATWDLPFGQGRTYMNQSGILHILFGGWQLGGIFTYGSGFPFTPLISGDPSNTGTFGSVRPNLTGDPSVPDPNPNRWFNTGAYSTPDAYTFGNAPRNSLTGPTFTNLDLYLAKRFGLGKDLSLELRIEAYNVLNHANFGQPDPFVDSDSGGTITSLSGPMRELQWGLRLYF